MIYKTKEGIIEGHKPTNQHFINLKKGLPLGLVGLQTKEGFVNYGMVTKCGEEEALCLKQQSVEVTIEEEQTCHVANLILVAESVAGYLRHGFTGCFVPTLYKKQKPRGTEMGIAYFGKPSQKGIEATEFDPQRAYDQEMGDGFFTMYRHFYEELKESSRRTKIPIRPVIGLDIRKSSQLGNIQMMLIVQGRTLFLCAPTLSKGDIILRTLASNGVTDFVHLPCQDYTIEETDRPMATALAQTEQEQEEYRRRLDELEAKALAKLKELRKRKKEEEKD